MNSLRLPFLSNELMSEEGSEMKVRSSHQPNGTFMSHRPVSITSRLVQLTDTCR